MRTLMTSTAVATLALAGCGPHWGRHHHDDDGRPLRVVTELQCPDHQGSLTRVRVSADGMSCDYAGPRGALVTLRLVKPEGDDAGAALKPIEAELNGMMPQVAGKVASSEVEVHTDETTTGSSHHSRGDRADIDLPGFHVHTNGGHAVVRMPGVNVDAQDDDEDGDSDHHGHSGHGAAHVVIGGGMVDVRAKDDAAIVRVHERGKGVRGSYILTDDNPGPDGWRMVGYEARGPAGGPIVIAVVKSKDKSEKSIFQDARQLVSVNAGG